MSLIFRVILLVLTISSLTYALEPAQVLVLANSDIPESIEVAHHYIEAREIPKGNLLTLGLGSKLASDISRENYQAKVALPVLNYLKTRDAQNKIKCIVTTYGIPYRIENVDSSKIDKSLKNKLISRRKEYFDKVRAIYVELLSLNAQHDISKALPKFKTTGELLSKTDAQLKSELKRISRLANNSANKSESRAYSRLYRRFYGYYSWTKVIPKLLDIDGSGDYKKVLDCQLKLKQASVKKISLSEKLDSHYYESIAAVAGEAKSLDLLTMQERSLSGKETLAALDSELSMLKFGDYELYRWQPNELKNRVFWLDVKTIMVSRLDGPTPAIAKALVDKAMRAEKKGLFATAYFDARGYSGNKSKGEFEKYDSSILRAAEHFKKLGWRVEVENTEKLFPANSCPDAGIYCGWYSLKKYIDSFSFVDGAVGYHIASWEAVHLRSTKSGEWVPNLLAKGITATIGAVSEPYLSAFPMPDAFFSNLSSGRQIVEAYYRSNPFNSWQMLLIADPLYRPFSHPQ